VTSIDIGSQPAGRIRQLPAWCFFSRLRNTSILLNRTDQGYFEPAKSQSLGALPAMICEKVNYPAPKTILSPSLLENGTRQNRSQELV